MKRECPKCGGMMSGPSYCPRDAHGFDFLAYSCLTCGYVAKGAPDDRRHDGGDGDDEPEHDERVPYPGRDPGERI